MIETNSGRGPVAQRVGIVVVHGVMPQVRYGIQDGCAADLTTALNADANWKGLGTWVASVLNPVDPAVGETLEPHPTITRVRLSGDDETKPERPHFDVIEAYWSPLDKGKTTFMRIVTWLLVTIFVPLNTTARYMARRGKTAYDVAFVSTAIVLVVAALAGALYATVRALGALIAAAGNCAPNCPGAWSLLFDPKEFGVVFAAGTLAVLAAGVLGALLVSQALKGAWSMMAQHAALAQRPAQRSERTLLVVLVFVTGLALLAVSALVPVNGGQPMGWAAIWFIVAALLLEGGRTLAKSFVVNFFGDVEIYTTRDENSDFFALREAILDLTTKTIAHVCSERANGGTGYDRVFVLAHSLGSTISLDALMRLSNLREQAPEFERDFERVRGFVTFGSPLEKTKYFTDVMNPSPSAAYEQWRDDLYGSLFTADAAVLDEAANASAKGIFWGNYWYFKDAIANELVSFRSFVPPRTSASKGHHIRRLMRETLRRQHVPLGHSVVGRLVCRNERGHKGLQLPEILPHGDYLGDPWFWRTDASAQPPHLGVLDVVARWDAGRGAKAAAASAAFAKPVLPGPGGATFETMPAAEAGKYVDRYPPPAEQPGAPTEDDTEAARP